MRVSVLARRLVSMLRDFLSFRTLLTPALIQGVFWVGVALIVVGSVVLMSAGGVGPILFGLVCIVAGPLLMRVLCELVLVHFQIREEIAELRAAADRANASGG